MYNSFYLNQVKLNLNFVFLQNTLINKFNICATLMNLQNSKAFLTKNNKNHTQENKYFKTINQLKIIIYQSQI